MVAGCIKTVIWFISICERIYIQLVKLIRNKLKYPKINGSIKICYHSSGNCFLCILYHYSDPSYQYLLIYA